MKPTYEEGAPTAGAAILPWPDGVARETGVSAVTLQRLRALGDSPRLYAVSERSLVTTRADLLAWISTKAVPPTYKCREATVVGKRAGGA
jgi:hypothetical protein